jgi:hypothetical protein
VVRKTGRDKRVAVRDSDGEFVRLLHGSITFVWTKGDQRTGEHWKCEPQITSAANLDISAGDYSGGVEFVLFFLGMSDLAPCWPNDARSREKSVDCSV